MGRKARQPQPVPLLPLLFLVMGAFGGILGILQGVSLFLYASVVCLVLAYISYTRRAVIEDSLSGLSQAPTRLLLALAVIAIVVGAVIWSINVRLVVGDGSFTRVRHPYSSQGVGLISLGLLAIIVGLAAKAQQASEAKP